MRRHIGCEEGLNRQLGFGIPTVGMLEPTTLEIASGEQTMVVYFRTCNGNCAILDEPNDFCRLDLDIKPNRSYRTVVRIVDRETATCTFDEAR